MKSERIRTLGKILVVTAFCIYLLMLLALAINVLGSCGIYSECLSMFGRLNEHDVNAMTFPILPSGTWLTFSVLGTLVVGLIFIVYSSRTMKVLAIFNRASPIYSFLVVALMFWIITRLIEIFDWGMGFERALILLVVLFAVPALVRLASSNHQLAVPKLVHISLSVAVFAFLGWHLLSFYQNFPNPNLVDIATTTLEAGKLMMAGKNPYTLPLDSQHAHYLYGPMMTVAFLPLGQLLGERGVVATNLLLDFAVLILVYLLGSRTGTPAAGLYSAVLYLITPYVPPEIYNVGANDLAAVVPLLVALLLVSRKKGLAGFFVGLSVATKLSPGVFLALCCFPRSGRLRYVCGVVIGMLPILSYLMISPTDLIYDTVLFPINRPVDSTSWMYGLSPEYRLVGSIVLAVTLLFTGAYVWSRDATLLHRCGLAVACIVVAILSATVTHRNYQLWWLPFFAVLVGAATFHKLNRMICKKPTKRNEAPSSYAT